MAALEPAEPENELAQAEYNVGESDVDAEGEDDMELDYSTAQTPAAENIGGDELSESDISEDQGVGLDEGEEEGAESDEESFVGAVKVPLGQDSESEEDAIDEDGSALNEDSADEAEDHNTDRSSNSAESVVAEEWEGGSECADDGDAEVANRNNCIFCGQDEEHDPCEEYEEYMACAVCGDNSHRQCARDNNSLESDDEASKWRCPGCVSNALEPDVEEQPTSRRRSSASKFTRDLLPASRGVSRPGSHSVFNTLILDDDPLDGSRSLRKRKASSEQAEELSKASVKRRKKQSTVDESDSEDPQSPSHANDTGADVIAPVEALLASAAPGKADAEAGSTSTNKAQHVRPARPRRPKKEQETNSHARVVRRNSTSLVLSFQLDPSRLREVQPRKKRRRPPPGLASSIPHPRFGTSHVSHYATPFYSFHERENDELKSKPYGGILSEIDADTSKTLPLAADRTRFEEARIKAEEDWKQKTASAEVENESKGRATQKVSGPPSKIKCINFGGYEIETWYAAPYPEEYSRNRVLYICEFCLKYMNSDYVAWRHKLKCPAKHPPGDEIYRDTSVSVFEVDGRKNPVYCQNLCLLAKLFLGSKTLYYDVEPFLFYIMTEYDELGCHFVGYFSKEKRPSSLNNVSCILTLPIHQRKGYGNLLIDFSYLLTRVEHKTGSPEKPLSDMGLVSYRNYWRLVLSYLLIDQNEPLSVIDISERTGMTADDIVAALEALRALVRDPVTKSYALRLDYAYFRQCIESWEAKAYVKLNPDALIWTPYVMGRGNLAHYDRAPPLATIAPREGDEEDPTVVPEEGVQQQLQAAALASANDNAPKANGNTTTSPLEPTTNGDHDFVSTPNTAAHPNITAGPPLLTPSLTRSSPEKPSINGIHPPSPPAIIPPTRYEVFPPVPGTTSRRRGGWRGGVRKSAAGTPTTATPARTGGKNLLPGKDGNTPRQTGLGLGKGKGNGKEQTPSGRRTRSTKEVDALDGAGKEADDESEERGSSEEDEDEVDNRGTGDKDDGEEADTPKDGPADQHGDAEDAMEE